MARPRHSWARRFPRCDLVRVPGGHHNDLWDAHLRETLAALRDFVGVAR